jgi:hypothetical protein
MLDKFTERFNRRTNYKHLRVFYKVQSKNINFFNYFFSRNFCGWDYWDTINSTKVYLVQLTN